MSLNFPSSPSNNQIYFDATSGNRYKYNAVNNVWFYAANNTIEGAATDSQVIFDDGGSANGSAGLVFNKTANTLFANSINVASDMRVRGNLYIGTNTVTITDSSLTVANLFIGNTTTRIAVATGDTTNAVYQLVNAAFTVANSAYAAQNADYTSSNAAYTVANAAFASVNTVGGYANTVGGYANTAGSLANQAGVIANAAFGHSNTTYAAVNSAFAVINAAFGSANTVGGYANTIGGYANTAGSLANQAGVIANASFGHSNTTYGAVNSSFGVINAAYTTVNSESTRLSAAYAVANAAYGQANTLATSANAYAASVGSSANAYTAATYATLTQLGQNWAVTNAAFGVANSALPKAGGTITGDLVVQGNTTFSGTTTYANTQTLLIGDNVLTLNADMPNTVAPSENAGIEVGRGSSANVAVQWNEGYDKWTFTNDGTTYYQVASNTDVSTVDSRLTSAYGVSNSGYGIANAAYGAVNSAFGVINAAYTLANSDSTRLSAAYVVANAGYGQANTLATSANAYASAVGTSTNNYTSATYSTLTQFGSVFGVANGAFAKANTALTSSTDVNNNYVAWGQLEAHNTYTDFNANVANWGFNYVQGSTNAPNSNSSQWYRGRFSLGNGYGRTSAAGSYWLELTYPRFNYTATTPGSMWMRVMESGTVGSWAEVGSLLSNIGYAASSYRAPIFYDSDNTGYYVDPSSSSVMNTLLTNGYTTYTSSGGYRARYTSGVDTYSSYLNWQGLQLGNNGGNYIVAGKDTAGGSLYVYTNATSAWPTLSGTASALFNSDGRFYSYVDTRSPIFYDSDNTGYYVDGAGTSVFNTLSISNISSSPSITGRLTFTSTQSVGSLQTATSSLGGIELYGGGSTNAAFMTFHRPGAWAAYFGLDNDNQFAVGGWSYGATLGDFKCRSIGVGTAASVSGGRIYAAGELYATIFYDYNNTGYYADPASTSVFNDLRAPGHILQVVQYVKTNTTSIAVSANTYNEFDSAFRVTITPKSTSSRIALSAYITGAQNTGTVRYKFQFSTNGGSTWTDVPGIGDANASHGQGHFGYAVNGDTNQFNTCSMELVHSPATTSAITYRVLFGQDVATTYHFNRSIAFPNSFLGATMSSTLIAKEIGG